MNGWAPHFEKEAKGNSEMTYLSFFSWLILQGTELTQLRLLPTFRGQKNRFFFYLTKLNSNIQPNISIKNSKTFKSTWVVQKNVFSNKS